MSELQQNWDSPDSTGEQEDRDIVVPEPTPSSVGRIFQVSVQLFLAVGCESDNMMKMGAEAYITINGEPLEDRQAMVVRIAMMALADIVSDRNRFKEEGVRVTDDCLLDIGAVLALIQGRRLRTQ